MPLALLALAVGAFGIGTTEFVMMGLLPDVADDLGISIPTAGHLVSAYALGVVIGAPLLAAVTTRMSRRAVLIALMALFVVGNALSAVAPGEISLLAARFVSGLPHGAFFGVGAVVATGMVAPERKARSVSLMFLGLTVANIVGVPAATAMGQQLGWRATFLGVSAIGVAAIAALAFLIPRDSAPAPTTGLRGELAALRSLPVWLALGTTVAGFGALFAAYSYITPMLTDAAGFAESSVTLLLALFGVGATAGNLLGGRLADHSLRGTLFGGLASLVVVLALFPLLIRRSRRPRRWPCSAWPPSSPARPSSSWSWRRPPRPPPWPPPPTRPPSTSPTRAAPGSAASPWPPASGPPPRRRRARPWRSSASRSRARRGRWTGVARSSPRFPGASAWSRDTCRTPTGPHPTPE